MKSKILGLLAVGLLAGPMGALAGSIGYTVGVTDFGESSNFGFTFGTAIAPVTGLAAFSFSGTFSAVDATGDGVSLSNFSLPEYWQLSVGNPLTTVDDVGGTLSLLGVGPFNFTASGLFDCDSIGGCDFLQISLYFGLSGGGDTATSTGTFSLVAASVPEPGTLALLGLGLAGLGLSRRRTAN